MTFAETLTKAQRSQRYRFSTEGFGPQLSSSGRYWWLPVEGAGEVEVAPENLNRLIASSGFRPSGLFISHSQASSKVAEYPWAVHEDLNERNLLLPSGSYEIHTRIRPEPIQLATKSETESISNSLSQLLISVASGLSPTLGENVAELLSLERGWDGEDAMSVRIEVLAAAIAQIDSLALTVPEFVVPFLAPTFEGYVLIDWADRRRTLELKAGPKGWSIVGTQITANAKNNYMTAHCGLGDPRIREYYQWFIGEALTWPNQ